MKMLTSSETFKKVMLNCSPDGRRRLQAAIDSKLLAIAADDETPDAIIGGPWPPRMHGAQRHSCDSCGTCVGLMQNSGIAAKERWPNVPVLCIACAKKRAIK